MHVEDVKHFLIVRRDTAFPYLRFDRRQWRVVAIGAEPMTKATEASLRERGYCEYREPTTD